VRSAAQSPAWLAPAMLLRPGGAPKRAPLSDDFAPFDSFDIAERHAIQPNDAHACSTIHDVSQLDNSIFVS